MGISLLLRHSIGGLLNRASNAACVCDHERLRTMAPLIMHASVTAGLKCPPETLPANESLHKTTGEFSNAQLPSSG